MTLADDARDAPTSAPERDARAAQLAQRREAGLHRVIWRWHFYAGLFVAPVVFVVALTGAIYIFKDDVERIAWSELLVVEPRADRAPLDAVVRAAESASGPGARAAFVSLFADPTRTAKVAVKRGDGAGRAPAVYVDPHTARATGVHPSFDFFEIVRTLHRRLFLSTIGRLLVELATSWAIVLFATGVFLWRPRKAGRVAGVWKPRFDGKRYVALRDLHALAGVYALPLTLLIAITGLFYSSMFGWIVNEVGRGNRPFAVFDPPPSKSPPEARSLTLDEAFARVRPLAAADSSWSVTLPARPGASYLFSEMSADLHSYRRIVAIDHATGEVLRDVPHEKFATLLWWHGWNYPLHVGSVLGWPTKLLWLGACVVLMTLPVTGFLMWRNRKPPDAWGLPRRPDVQIPVWLIGLVALFSLALPAVGLSVIAVLAYEEFAHGAPRRRAKRRGPRRPAVAS